MAERQTGDFSRPAFVPVCAIGASAGGVGVLQTLFRLLPDDLGLAYVVVVHLAPDQPSAMHEILGACTRMPVHQVQDGPTLRANCVYVIPPGRELVIEGDDVTARPFTDPRGRRAPIDMFFRSVAAARGDGIAVVLTGAGADGAVGVRAVKEAGGLVMVQEPAEAGFPSMPQNAIATGVADVVAPVARLAERIAEAARSKEAVRSLDEDGAADDLRRIVAFLRTRTGHDFSGYKRATVLRRVTRRMQVCRITTLDDYARHLRAAPEEARALFADLLISVTMFFRDPGAFAALARHVVHPLLERAGAEEGEGGIRAWVVGCATGEEAYSIAILMIEEAERLKLHVPVQIFATDLDEGALATAREGRYPRSIEADVSPERLGRFFVDEGTHYRIQRSVRDLVLFATHSVVREPPFMRLDLVTCRNVLIYLERALQQHACAIFHYGLKPGGFLFLGTAETADMAQDRFAAVDREARIYRARDLGRAPVPVLAPTVPPGFGRSIPPAEGRAGPGRFAAGEALGASHAAALEAGAPPSALVDADQTVLHLSPTAGRFMRLTAGPLSGRLPDMVHPELRLDLGLALDRAFGTRQPTVTGLVDLDLDGAMRRVSVHVAPVPSGEGAPARAIAFFLDNGPGLAPAAPEDLPVSEELLRLHGELRAAQEAALAGHIAHEAALQELRASNEELQSLNEEYRSTAEELETSKEELQSINEELQTVNAELKVKLSAISAAHDDLQNLTASSEIGTLFLDTGLRIRMFTPRVAELINVTPADVGRPVTDLTHRLAYDGLEGDVRRVLRDLRPTETEVRGLGNRWFTLRVRPYRTLDDRIAGAVVTFDDITARKRGEEALRASEELRRSLITQMNDGFCILEVILDEAGRGVDYRFVETNPAFLQQGGFDPAGRLMSEIAPIEPVWPAAYGRVAVTGLPERIIGAAAAFDRIYEVYAFRVGAPADRRIAVFFTDITARTAAQDKLRASEEQQAFLLALGDALRPLAEPRMIAAEASRLLGDHLHVDRTFLTEVEHDGVTLFVRDEYLREGASSVLGRYSFDQFGAFVSRALHEGRILAVENVSALAGLTADERATYAGVGIAAYLLVPLVRDGRLAACLTINHRAPRAWTEADRTISRQTADRTWTAMERARAEAALARSERRLRTLVEGIPQAVWRATEAGVWTWSSPQWTAYTGLDEEESRGDGWLAALHPDDRERARAAWSEAARGEPLDIEARIRHAATGAYRWFQTRGLPVRDGSGAVTEWLGTSTDVQDLKALQERQQVLVAELQHRTRNLIAVVRGVADDTMEETGPTAAFRDAFFDRLSALSRVQGLLSRAEAEPITIGALLRLELDALGPGLPDGRVAVEGPDILLKPSTVQTLALALHELATNARKYGALSHEGGRLAVTWRERDEGGEPRLALDWIESGLDFAPERPQGGRPDGGYGRELIERALPHAMGARTRYALTDSGLSCSLDIPVRPGRGGVA